VTADLNIPIASETPNGGSLQRLVLQPFYDVAGITIYCGDMREIVPLLGNVDAVVTDPPYGETCLEWDKWPDGWLALLVDKTPQIWCFGSMRMFWDKSSDFRDWRLAQDVVWEKHNGSGLQNDRFRRVHENAVHLYRGDWASLYKCPPIVTVKEQRHGLKLKRTAKPQHFGGIEAGSGYEYDGNRIMRSVIPVNSCHGYAEHPTQKPEGIIRPLVEYSVPAGGIVLDPFMGSGTTLRVAKDLGRRAIGIEANETYCRSAVARLAQDVLGLENDQAQPRGN